MSSKGESRTRRRSSRAHEQPRLGTSPDPVGRAEQAEKNTVPSGRRKSLQRTEPQAAPGGADDAEEDVRSGREDECTPRDSRWASGSDDDDKAAETSRARQQIRSRPAPGSPASPPSKRPPAGAATTAGRPAPAHAGKPAKAAEDAAAETKRRSKGGRPGALCLGVAAALIVGALALFPGLLAGDGGEAAPLACTQEPDDTLLAALVPPHWADWSLDLSDALRAPLVGAWRPRRQAVTVLLSARSRAEAAAIVAAARLAFPACGPGSSVTLDGTQWRSWVPAGVRGGTADTDPAVLREVRGYIQSEIVRVLKGSSDGSGLILVPSVEALPVGALPPLLAAMGEDGSFVDGGDSLPARGLVVVLSTAAWVEPQKGMDETDFAQEAKTALERAFLLDSGSSSGGSSEGETQRGSGSAGVVREAAQANARALRRRITFVAPAAAAGG